MLASESPFRIVYVVPGLIRGAAPFVAVVPLLTFRPLGRVVAPVLPARVRLGVEGASVGAPPNVGAAVGVPATPVAVAGIFSVDFTFSRFGSTPGLAASIAFTLTLYFFAISVSMSPFCTTCVVPPVVVPVAPNAGVDPPNELPLPKLGDVGAADPVLFATAPDSALPGRPPNELPVDPGVGSGRAGAFPLRVGSSVTAPSTDGRVVGVTAGIIGVPPPSPGVPPLSGVLDGPPNDGVPEELGPDGLPGPAGVNAGPPDDVGDDGADGGGTIPRPKSFGPACASSVGGSPAGVAAAAAGGVANAGAAGSLGASAVNAVDSAGDAEGCVVDGVPTVLFDATAVEAFPASARAGLPFLLPWNTK